MGAPDSAAMTDDKDTNARVSRDLIILIDSAVGGIGTRLRRETDSASGNRELFDQDRAGPGITAQIDVITHGNEGLENVA